METVAELERPRGYGLIAILCMAHALVVLVTWLGGWVSAGVWLFLSWAWLLWPLALFLHPGRSARRILLPLIGGIALLAPCVPTIVAFTVWSIRGFAS